MSLTRNRATTQPSGLDSPPEFCHADAATCQNSREVPQIADEFRHVSLPGCARKSLQNQRIQPHRIQEVAGSSPASSIRSPCKFRYSLRVAAAVRPPALGRSTLGQPYPEVVAGEAPAIPVKEDCDGSSGPGGTRVERGICLPPNGKYAGLLAPCREAALPDVRGRPRRGAACATELRSRRAPICW